MHKLLWEFSTTGGSTYEQTSNGTLKNAGFLNGKHYSSWIDNCHQSPFIQHELEDINQNHQRKKSCFISPESARIMFVHKLHLQLCVGSLGNILKFQYGNPGFSWFFFFLAVSFCALFCLIFLKIDDDTFPHWIIHLIEISKKVMSTVKRICGRASSRTLISIYIKCF